MKVHSIRASVLLASALLGAAALTGALRAETIGIGGFIGLSPGVCSIIPTTVCTNYTVASGEAERICRVPPRVVVKIVGHSMGGSGAIGLVRDFKACGVPARAVAFDPQGQTDDPDVLAIYSAGWAGVGAGVPGAICLGGGHWGPLWNTEARAMARTFLVTGKRPIGNQCSATPAPNANYGTILRGTP